MGYLCLTCGNEDSFEGRRDYTEYGREYIYVDGEGDVQDYGDRDETDSDYDNTDIDECSECNSTDVQWFNDEEEQEERREQALAENERRQARPVQTNGSSVVSWKIRVGDTNDTNS